MAEQEFDAETNPEVIQYADGSVSVVYDESEEPEGSE